VSAEKAVAKVRCVVAEDESLLREALVAALRQAWPELSIEAECADGGSALEAIAELQPDVAFLDIRMPGLTGLEVAAAAVTASPKTQLVFVTAYDQYAIDAFDKGAVDYLLKPIQPERLAQTVKRVQARVAAPALPAGGNEALSALLDQLTAALPRKLGEAAPPLTWLTASTGNATRLIMVDEVVYFRADQKYTTVMTATGEALLRKPIKDLLEVLDPQMFKQIHRATVVNMKAIDSITRDDTGRGLIKLKSRPEVLTVSQPFMHLFRAM
jgi:DNA-binding LytR/AlgR family response regulator